MRGFDRAIFPEEEINGPALLVYGAVQVMPAAFDQSIRLLRSPRTANHTSEAVPPFLELRHIPDHHRMIVVMAISQRRVLPSSRPDPDRTTCR